MKNKQNVVIVIPTYNEAGNIGKLIDYFYDDIFPKIPDYQMHMVVVDGNSTDMTAQIVEEKMRQYTALHLIKEKQKAGIGAAYVKGFAFAKNMQADVVIEFDADFQHPPEVVFSLLAKIAEGYDYVLGSRNIPGGGESLQRSFLRVCLTKFGGFLAKCILFFPSKHFFTVTDPTTGLKATRVKGFIDKLNLNESQLYSKQFGYKVQFLYQTIYLGAKYTEIPLQFENRLLGTSKFQKSTAYDILISCIKTRLRA